MIAASLAPGAPPVPAARLGEFLGTSRLRSCHIHDSAPVSLAGWADAGTGTNPIFAIGTVRTVFDGWIANRPELRRELALSADAGDSEIYSHAVQAWGDRADAHVDGHYAAIWASPSGLRLARSPLAAPPLHWKRNANRIVAASLLRCLELVDGAPLGRIDLELQHAVLAGDLRHAERGWYPDTGRVPLGRAIWIGAVDDSPRDLWRYRFSPDPATRGASLADAVSRTSHLLDAAVAGATCGNERIAISLSGGLDSSLVAEAAMRVRPQSHVSAYCYAPEGDAPQPTPGDWPRDWVLDETGAARDFARFHGDRLTLEPVRSDGADFRTGMDDLLAISRCAPREIGFMFQLADACAMAAANGCTAMLGGDEGNSTISASGSWAYRHWFLRLRWRRMWRELRLRAHDERPIWRRFGALVLRQLLPRRTDRHTFERYLANLGLPRDTADRLHWGTRPQTELPVTGSARAHGPREIAALLENGDDGGRGDALKAVECRHGIPYRDPTVTRALAEYCLALAPDIFLHDGVNRRLAREIAKGKMPEAQRLGVRHGLTGADWLARTARNRSSVLGEITRMQSDPDIASIIDLAAIKRRVESLPETARGDVDDLTFTTAGLPAAIAAGRMIARAKGRNNL